MATWVTLGVALKTRIAPLHFWGGAFVTRLSNATAFFFLTWQKIAPIVFLFVSRNKGLVNGLVLVNVIVGRLNGLGAKSLWILLFFSGLLHMR